MWEVILKPGCLGYFQSGSFKAHYETSHRPWQCFPSTGLDGRLPQRHPYLGHEAHPGGAADVQTKSGAAGEGQERWGAMALCVSAGTLRSFTGSEWMMSRQCPLIRLGSEQIHFRAIQSKRGGCEADALQSILFSLRGVRLWPLTCFSQTSEVSSGKPRGKAFQWALRPLHCPVDILFFLFSAIYCLNPSLHTLYYIVPVTNSV